MKTTHSPKELAQAIGVSESSIKRWVDDGLILATKTAGGHRRIGSAEAVRFIRESRATLVDPTILGFSDIARLGDSPPAPGENETETFFNFLRNGAAAEARGYLLALYLQGRSVAQIVDGPLSQAMERIGTLWVDNPSGIFWEHRATDIAIHSVTTLRQYLRQAANAPKAVGGAPAGDPYILPSLCAAAILEDEGFYSVNLGPQTPMSALLAAVETINPVLVWLSVSFLEHPDRLARDTASLLQRLAEDRIPLAVGGAASSRLNLPISPLLYRGSSMTELVALLAGMRVSAPIISEPKG